MSPHALLPSHALPSGVHALMTTRSGGLSPAPFDSNNLGIYTADPKAQSNRETLQAMFALPRAPLWLKQVHGRDCVYSESVSDEHCADAVWTDVPGRVLAVQSADCLPVVFASRCGGVVAAAHAGWRGLAEGVLEATLLSMPADNHNIVCWLSAAIGPCCFEVGAEVRDAFCAQHPEDAAAFSARPGAKYLANLYKLAEARLRRAGVAMCYAEHSCTVCEPQRFFSYRRDGAASGRMATLVWLAAPSTA